MLDTTHTTSHGKAAEKHEFSLMARSRPQRRCSGSGVFGNQGFVPWFSNVCQDFIDSGGTEICHDLTDDAVLILEMPKASAEPVSVHFGVGPGVQHGQLSQD